ncbi:MAG: radical SAM protein [archaeon GB-1867-035]|nr:radical SAM protein [Candidatus Culexmicrobium profundum]
MLRLLVWLCTYKCNLNCNHCYVKGRNVNEMNTEDAIRMISEIVELNPRHFSITGGEPLLRKDIFTILKEAKKQGLNTSIVTNGLLLNEQVIDKLSKMDIYIYLSLDSASEETFNKIRGWNRSKLLEKIEILRKKNVEFSTIMTIMPENYHEAGLFIELSLNIGAKHAALIPVIPSGGAKNKQLTQKQLIKAIESIDEKSNEYGYPTSLWCTPFAKWIKKSKYIYVGSCPDDSMDIDPAGNTLLCDVLEFKISNVLKYGVKEAWLEYSRNPISKNFRNPDILEGKCMECRYKFKCVGGCKARAYLTYGKFTYPDPLCPL